MELSSVQEVAMFPVRATVSIVRLPIKLLGSLYSYVCAALAFVISFPVSFGKRFCNKISCTWEWTKMSVRSSLGFREQPAITDGKPESSDPLDLMYHGSRRRRLSKREKKEMISRMLRMILEPGSSAESDDEIERPAPRQGLPQEPDSLDRDMKLIQDLVKLSRSSGRHSASGQASQREPALKQDLEAMLEKARDRDTLAAMIKEIDQVDIELPQPQGASIRAQEVPALDEALERPVSQNSSEAVYTPAPCSSSDENNDEDEKFHEVPDTLPRPLYKPGVLSPVQESPEYLSASSESLKMNQLQEGLSKALDKLSTATQELDLLNENAEYVETEITQKTVTVTEGQADLECVPKTVPLLGVQVGHQRRDLANARNSRPPTKKLFQGSTSQDKEDTDSSSDDEPSETRPPRRHSAGAPPQLAMSDQITLLTAGTQNWPKTDSIDQDEVETEARTERQGSEPPKFSRQNSNSSDTDKKVAIPNNKPPWMDMRNRSNSNCSDTDPSTVVIFKPPPSKRSRSVSESLPDANKTENIWNTDPALDNQDSIYDTLAPVNPPPPAQPLYLHEKLALRAGTSSVEPSPRLPPRNGLTLKRAASDEVVSRSPPREHSKSTTKKKSPATKESRSRSREHEPSKSKRPSSSDKSTRESRSRTKDERESRPRSKDERESRSKTKDERESRSRTKEDRHSRSKVKEERESRSRTKDDRSQEKDRHHSSSHHRSKSSDRASSHSTHKHSSERHRRSRSGERSSSRSTERHERHSTHRHSSSDRPSSSGDKKSSASKSSSKASVKTEPKKKVLPSPLAALFSRTTPSPKVAKDDKKTSSSRAKADEKRSSKSEKRRSTSGHSSPDKESDSSSGRSVVRSVSSSSLRSAGAASVYSFDSALSGRVSDV